MRIIVDTSIWSELLRRGEPDPVVYRYLGNILHQGDAVILGPIRQEMLSGIRESMKFAELRNALRAFPDETILATDYETAAEFSNLCRPLGIQGSGTDYLICAVSARLPALIYTSDRDFAAYAKVLPINLFMAT